MILYFLIHLFFDAYLLLVLLRLVFQYLRVDYYHPLSQFVVKATSMAVTPLRRWIPGYGDIDMATVVLLVGVVFAKVVIGSLVLFHKFPSLSAIFLWGLGEVGKNSLKLFFYAVLAQSVFSYLPAMRQSTLAPLLQQITSPIFSRVRRYIKPYKGYDLAPIALLLGLQLCETLIFGSLIAAGKQLAKF